MPASCAAAGRASSFGAPAKPRSPTPSMLVHLRKADSVMTSPNTHFCQATSMPPW